MQRRCWVLLLAFVACTNSLPAGSGSRNDGGSGAGDGNFAATDSGLTTGDPIAPNDVKAGAKMVVTGDNGLAVGAGQTVYRLDAPVGTHVGFDLRFTPESAAATLKLEIWNGEIPLEAAVTNSGPGLRVLSVLEATQSRTYWLTVELGGDVSSATLTATHTPFAEGASCTGQCGTFLQLPIPSFSSGYYLNGTDTNYRWQYGRRDLLMSVRHAASQMAQAGYKAISVGDVSQWNGETPGYDIGDTGRHDSHKLGEDIDLSLYSSIDGTNQYREHDYFCDTVGDFCVAGTVRNFDARANALLLANILDSDRVWVIFLDPALIEVIRGVAPTLSQEGHISAGAYEKIMATGDPYLYPEDYHENHIHIRYNLDSLL